MDLNVTKIDKNDNNTWRTIYQEFMKVTFSRLKYFPERLSIYVKSIKTIHKKFQLISRRILKNYHRKKVYMRRWWGSVVTLSFRIKIPENNLKENTCFKDILQDWSIGLILIWSGLKKISVQDNLHFMRVFFKPILNVNLE